MSTIETLQASWSMDSEDGVSCEVSNGSDVVGQTGVPTERRSLERFTISDIDAVIEKVEARVYISYRTATAGRLSLNRLGTDGDGGGDPSTLCGVNNLALFGACGGGAEVTRYAIATYPAYGDLPDWTDWMDLGAQAIIDFQSAVDGGEDYWSIGMDSDDAETGEYYQLEEFDETYPAELRITHSERETRTGMQRTTYGFGRLTINSRESIRKI